MVTESFLPQVNGVTNSVRRVLEHLDHEGHEALLVAPSGPDEYAGAPIHHVRSVAMPTYRDFPIGLATRGHLRRLMPAYAPDVVHLASPAWLGHQAGEAARSLGMPGRRGLPDRPDRVRRALPVPGCRAAMRRLTRRVHGPADRTLVPSSASGDQLAGLGIERLHRWGRGVDTALFAPAPPRPAALRAGLQAGDRTLVGYVGRLAAEKELELLAHVQDLPGVRRRCVVGGGPEEHRLRTAAARGPPSSAYATARTSPGSWPRSTCSCTPAAPRRSASPPRRRWPAGCRSSRPRAGGPLDLVREGVNGFLYPPGDGPAPAGARRSASPPTAGCGARWGPRPWPACGTGRGRRSTSELLAHYRAVAGTRPVRLRRDGLNETELTGASLSRNVRFRWTRPRDDGRLSVH